MSAALNKARYSVQHLAEKPRGWRVRSKRSGEHVLRIAFPPKRGKGKVLEVLHPKKNPACQEGSCGPRSNPAELVIFTNPTLPLPKDAYEVFEISTGRVVKTGVTIAEANAYVAKHKGKKYAVRPVGTNPGKNRRRAAARKRAGQNPDETQQAVRLFQSFHGKDPKGVTEAQRSAAIRKDYTALGKLMALGFDDRGWAPGRITNNWDQLEHLDFADAAVTLASAPNGKQLYFIDGDQNLDSVLGDFEGVDPAKDLIDLGEVFFVVYEARKVHSNFEPTDWVHSFGEDTGVRPRLAYDKLKKEMFLVGGEYFIDTKSKVSPGIEN